MDRFPSINKIVPEEAPEISREEVARAIQAEASLLNLPIRAFFDKYPGGFQNTTAISIMFQGLTKEQLQGVMRVMEDVLIPGMVLSEKDK